MKVEEKIALHRRMSESYYNAYVKPHGAQSGDVKGATYEAWKFAKGATGRFPFFAGNAPIDLAAYNMAPGVDSKDDMAAKSAAMEAAAYSISFQNWTPVEFECYPCERGFVQKVRWEGITKNATRADGTKVPDGTKVGFFSFSVVETNDNGEITRWETYVNEEMPNFCDMAIHNRGPFKGFEYHSAVYKRLKEAGVKVQ